MVFSEVLNFVFSLFRNLKFSLKNGVELLSKEFTVCALFVLAVIENIHTCFDSIAVITAFQLNHFLARNAKSTLTTDL